ncbi:hypothetical protein ACFLQR_04635, partial [Verrucomicrobiota bacterium]
YTLVMMDVYARNPGAFAYLNDEPAFRFGKFLYNVPDEDRQQAAEEFLARPDVQAFVKKHRLSVSPETLLNRDRAMADKKTWMLAGDFAKARQEWIRERLHSVLRERGLGMRSWINSISKFNDWSRCVSIPTLLPGNDLASMDVYLCGSVIEAMYLEMVRAVSTDKVLHAAGWKFRTPQEWRNSCYLTMLHAEGIVIFALPTPFEQMTGWSGSRKVWRPGIWEETERVFAQARKVASYIGNGKPESEVAILVSERSQWANYEGGWATKYGISPSMRYISNISGLFGLLTQLHYMPKMIYAEYKLEEKLRQTKVLFVSLGEALTDPELDSIRQWVKQGGILFAFGRTSRFNEFGEPLKNYRFAKLFGCDFVRERGNRLLMKQIRPEVVYPQIRYGKDAGFDYTSEHYQGVLRYDEVKKHRDAKVIATWKKTMVGADGTPAAVMNKYGKGVVYFFPGTDLPLCFRKEGLVKRDKTTGPAPDAAGNYELWQSFEPMLTAMIKKELAAALGATQRQPKWRFEGLPANVEVTVKKAKDALRYVVQFHKFQDHEKPVSNAVMYFNKGEEKPLTTALFPLTEKTSEVEAGKDKQWQRIDIPEFKVYQILVLE